MGKWFALVFLGPMTAWSAGTRISCDHVYFGTPFATIAFDQQEDGSLGTAATVTQTGYSHEELISALPAASGERAHFLISPQSENELEMIVYTQPQAQGQSHLINKKMPIGRDIWGSCRFAPL